MNAIVLLASLSGDQADATAYKTDYVCLQSKRATKHSQTFF